MPANLFRCEESCQLGREFAGCELTPEEYMGVEQ